jgi:hypothetical protein
LSTPYESGYVWGTYRKILTESLFAYKLWQYPDDIGSYATFIREIWLGHSTFSTTADTYAHLDVSAQVETGDVASGFFIKSSPVEPLAFSETAENSTLQAEDNPQTPMAPTFTC